MSYATQLIGGRADIPASTVSQLANVAQWDVISAVEPLEMEVITVSSTTSGGNRITLPTDFQTALVVSNLSVSPYQLLTKKNVYDIDSSTTQLGIPQNYVLYENWMELWPSPDSSYSIQLRYQARPSVLTLASASPSFDTRFHYAWVLRTAFHCATNVKDESAAAYCNALYEGEIRSKPSDLALRQRDRNGQNIRPMYKAQPKWDSSRDFDNSVFPPASLYGP